MPGFRLQVLTIADPAVQNDGSCLSGLMWCLRLQPKYLQLTKKLGEEFPGRLDICSEGTPQVTGFFEVFVAGKLIDSKKGGDGYVDTEGKFLKLVAIIKASWLDVP